MLFKTEKGKKQKGKLNKLQAAQLLDAINAGHTVKVNACPASMNKGYRDTPLFTETLPDLFK
ncbi:MAG: hypothetical protein WKF87_06625 [Chryseolinea sp.]